ncbi:MAG: hypothetical protein ACRBDI_09445 [Alphaproteobacteria bacterium]
MSLTLALWIFIVVFFLWFWAWTSFITYRQINGWKLFAKKRNLRFHSNGFLETPSLSGAIDGYKVSVFASEHSELDQRSQRRLTAIEVSLHTSLPVSAAFASGGMVSVVEPIDLNHEYKPSLKEWDDSYIIRTQDNKVVEHYFDDERAETLISLMKKDKAWVVLLFLSDSGLLRFDTPLPFDNPKELDEIVKSLISAAKIMDLRKGESESLLRKRSNSVGTNEIVDIDEGLLIDNVGFELEDDA